jgi:peptidoglycan-associated lipoprotein
MQASRIGRFLTLAAAALLVAACETTPLDEKPEEQPPAPVTEAGKAPTTTQAQPGAVTEATPTTRTIDELDDPKSVLAKREVYFDFDRFDVKLEFIPLVEAHGRYLATHRERKIVIEGNADERGSREYNLALGQKRADAVKSRLILLGASEVQIETISFGEERPRATGHDEAAWAENRRADIVYR